MIGNFLSPYSKKESPAPTIQCRTFLHTDESKKVTKNALLDSHLKFILHDHITAFFPKNLAQSALVLSIQRNQLLEISIPLLSLSLVLSEQLLSLLWIRSLKRIVTNLSVKEFLIISCWLLAVK